MWLWLQPPERRRENPSGEGKLWGHLVELGWPATALARVSPFKDNTLEIPCFVSTRKN